jgi:hypothetical protein
MPFKILMTQKERRHASRSLPNMTMREKLAKLEQDSKFGVARCMLKWAEGFGESSVLNK